MSWSIHLICSPSDRVGCVVCRINFHWNRFHLKKLRLGWGCLYIYILYMYMYNLIFIYTYILSLYRRKDGHMGFWVWLNLLGFIPFFLILLQKGKKENKNKNNKKIIIIPFEWIDGGSWQLSVYHYFREQRKGKKGDKGVTCIWETYHKIHKRAKRKKKEKGNGRLPLCLVREDSYIHLGLLSCDFNHIVIDHCGKIIFISPLLSFASWDWNQTNPNDHVLFYSFPLFMILFYKKKNLILILITT